MGNQAPTPIAAESAPAPPVGARIETIRRRLVDVLPLVITVFVFHRDLVFRGRALFDRDVENFRYERLMALAAAVRAGEWPLWNPYPAFGEPMLALAQELIAYPTTWLAVLMPVEVAEAVSVVFHTLLAGLGAWALARELGVSNRGALTAGVVWSLSGPVQSCANQLAMLVGAAYVPWAWTAWSRIGRTARPVDAVAAGLTIAACFLGGAPESALMAMAGVVLAVRGSAREAAVRVGRALPVVLLVGLGLSAVQWVPTAALVPRSARARLSGADRDQWSNHPARLAELVLPLPVEHLPLRDEVRAGIFSGREPLLYSLYVGLGALGLVGAALLGPRRHARGLLAVMAVVAFAFSLGPHGLLWTAVRDIPPLSLVRYPGRFAIVGTLPLAILAGMGVDALGSAPRAGGKAAHLILAALVASGAACLASFAHPGAPLWRAILIDERELGWRWSSSPTIAATLVSLAVAALLASVVALAIALRGSRGFPPAAAARMALAAALAVALDPLIALRHLSPTVPRSVLRLPNPALAPVPRERPNRTLVVKYSRAQSIALLGRESPTQHLFDATPAERLWNDRYYPFDSLGLPGWNIESLPADVTVLRDVTVGRWVTDLSAVTTTPLFPRVLELSGISYVIALHDLAPAGLELVGTAPGRDLPVRTFRVPRTLPRAFAPGGVRVAEGPEAFRHLMDRGFDPRQEIVLAAATPAPADAAGRVRILRLGFDRVSLEADMDRAGHVVLLEAWAPDWRATVDGVPAPVLAANVIFRAVPVGPGRHHVEMRYRPPSATIGLGVSLVTLAGLAIAAACARRRSPGATEPA